MEVILNVDWVAIAVGAFAAFVVGWGWYSDMAWGKVWRKGVGIDTPHKKDMLPAMVTQLVSTVLLSWTVWLAMYMAGVWMAVLVGLTIMGIVKANGLFAGKAKAAILVEVSFLAVSVAVMVVVNSVM